MYGKTLLLYDKILGFGPGRDPAQGGDLYHVHIQVEAFTVRFLYDLFDGISILETNMYSNRLNLVRILICFRRGGVLQTYS